MSKYVIDAYAWIEYLRGSEKGEKVKSIIENKQNEVLTSAITIAEVLSKFMRSNEDYYTPLKAINVLSRVIDVDEKTAVKAALAHAEMRKKINDFGLADAFVIAISKNLQAKIVTGDKHFQNIPNTIMI
jgi:predicted nucleic acid-binding protein